MAWRQSGQDLVRDQYIRFKVRVDSGIMTWAIVFLPWATRGRVMLRTVK